MSNEDSRCASAQFRALGLDASYYSDYRLDFRRGRERALRSLGFTRDEIIAGVEKSRWRRTRYYPGHTPLCRVKPIERLSLAQRRRFLNLCKECEFNLDAESSRYGRTGIDWAAYHRPSSNGIGWVCIAPDEPSNNVYTNDPILVKYLRRRYLGE